MVKFNPAVCAKQWEINCADDAVKPKFGLYEMITVDVSLSYDFILFLVPIEFEILF